VRRALAAAALCAAVSIASGAAEEGAAAKDAYSERPSIAVEAVGLAYGLVALSPRISLSGSLPIASGLSLQASPALAWGGEGETSFLEIALPLLARGTIRLGTLTPYAAAGLELGLGRLGRDTGIFAAGPVAEAGERFYMFGSGIYVEPYIGGAVMAAWRGGDGPVVTPSLFGGIRIGLSL
jgi:hypothetical protein